jgi:hypothetical protein
MSFRALLFLLLAGSVLSVDAQSYPWVAAYETEACLYKQVAVPNGFTRIAAPQNSFTYWLRRLPLAAKGTPVRLHDGQKKLYQEGAYRVLDIDVGRRNLQQCADAVMRLRAEYLYSQKAYEKIKFNYTNGTTVRYKDWAQGKRPVLKGRKVVFSHPNGKTDYSYRTFKKYLTNIFIYAGTASLEKELKPKTVQQIEAGNVFIRGGYPGHAVLVVDVAQNSLGERIFMLAQSYMPAQSIHILVNPNLKYNSPWYKVSDLKRLETPEWQFHVSDLHSF